MVNINLAWIAYFSPLVAAIIIALFFLRSKALSSWTAIAGIVTSFVATLLLFSQMQSAGHNFQAEISYPWLSIGPLSIDFGVLINPLAIMMLLVVTGVGSAIFVYSRGYMADDPSQPRFFAFLSLFAFSMIGIVLANNFIQLFMFWELVGLSSYLLIGFWYEKPSASAAAVKAFMVNRLADFGFLCGIFLIWSLSGGNGSLRTFSFSQLTMITPQMDQGVLALIGVLIFCGVLGKSAQVPFHVWLADAMEGPTPVSALIHAATMVAAGIYLLARTFFIFAPCPTTLNLIANIGGLTAFLAATLAVAENDIKRILAYSTLSQLGLMVMALGLGGPLQGMYHLTTHAFFKALLFLGAGSVIYALHHEQNIWKMQGLFRAMPITGWTFLIGTLALCGVFPLSGFWSKDEILALAFEKNTFLFFVATLTSLLTSFYMGRLFWVAFWGQPQKQDGHLPHESPLVMTLPLVFLAVLSAIGGFLGIEHLIYPEEGHHELNLLVALVSTGVAVLGLGTSFLIYRQRYVTDPLPDKLGVIYPILKNKYYFDDIYGWYVDKVQQTFAFILSIIEKVLIIEVGVHGSARAAKMLGDVLRRLQNGIVQFYAFIFVFGFLLLFIYFLRVLS